MNNKKKNLVILSGAGVSKESGLGTFRDLDGFWKKYDWQKLASIDGWEEDPAAVLEFYNARHAQLAAVKPNHAHELIAELEKYYNVNIITQNVDDLHERAGSTKVLHLHGEMAKRCSSADKETCIEPWPLDESIEIGDEAQDGSQMRPYIVWFGEDVPNISRAVELVRNADVFVVIGTSLKVSPANGLAQLSAAKQNFVIDPNEVLTPKEYQHIKDVATVGMQKLYEILLKQLDENEKYVEFPIDADTECWDMKRFVMDYIRFADEVGVLCEERGSRWGLEGFDYSKLLGSQQIAMSQLYAYACATLNKPVMDNPSLETIQEMFSMKGNVFMDGEMFYKAIEPLGMNKREAYYRFGRRGDPITVQTYRSHAMRVLLEMIGEVSPFKNPYSGVIECAPIYTIGISAYRNLYAKAMRECTDKIVDVIVALSDFADARKISVDELQVKYQYPEMSISYMKDKEMEDL